MSTAVTRVSVLLVGLPAFYEGLLEREFGPESGITVRRLADDALLGTIALEPETVLVVGATPPLLRRASERSARDPALLGVVAVTDAEPRGDVYVVTPAGMNVTRAELAGVIRDVVAAPPFARGGRRPPAGVPIRSDP